jgi:phosphatidylglycerophosphate synthase
VSAGPALALVAPEVPPEIAPETVLLGLPMIRRTVLAAFRAGFARVLVVGAPPGLRAALGGTPAELAAEAPAGATRLPWNVVVTGRDLKSLASGGEAAGTTVRSRADFAPARRRLLQDLVKDTEGFMSRHVERKISLAVSRLLAGTRITPNAMTLVSVAVGLAGAPFFLSAAASQQTIGGILFLLHSILDGCDGELARLKFQESRFGGVLDFWGDNVVHVAVFAAMGVGWSRAAGDTWPLLFGLSAVAGTFASALFVYLRTMTGKKDGPLYTSVALHRETTVTRIADALSRRDFIYIVLILSLFGKAHWFVAVAAVATPFYFLTLVGIAWSERRFARSVS